MQKKKLSENETSCRDASFINITNITFYLPFFIILGAVDVTSNTSCELHHCTQPVHLLPHPPHAAAEVRTVCYHHLPRRFMCRELEQPPLKWGGLMFGHFSKPRVHDDICSKSDSLMCSSLHTTVITSLILADYSCQVWRQGSLTCECS